ncbi:MULTISPECIES: RAMP superfamily CRISPR-associated protein [unclassified Thiocapsa]|uniref:RAMP superfamily CRISPR-associated protein n=1 Tax=unclassified Thiocapsa TaxID=2641286 RepID=UPI0035B46225
MTDATLSIEIQSYWHPGTGRGSGYHLDAITHTGADGLPRLPGRTLKGLLRDALYRAEVWGWPETPRGTTDALFGPRGDGIETLPGLLRFADATLPPVVARYLASSEGAHLVPGLYREHFSTAIVPKKGVAKQHSLRGMRVVVPLTLQASISEVPGLAPIAEWENRLAACFCLVNAVGAHRSRGFGRARLAWKEA